MKNKNLLLLILGILSFTFIKAQTSVPALITSNQVWDVSGSPYIIGQNTYIGTGVSVIVKPGVQIKGGGYKISIDGEFQASGKWDSIIKISDLLLEFSSKSMDYNKSTGRGAYFNYCNLTGSGSGNKAISATTTSLKIDNCIFSGFHFSVYTQSSYPYDTISTDITNSTFYGDSYGYGYPITGNIMESKLTVINCIFNSLGSIYTYGNVIFKNNTIKKLSSFNSSYLFGKNEFSCNKFINITEGITIDISGYKSKGSLTFNNNTIDSFGSSISFPYPMFTLTRPYASSPPFGSVEIKNNNFLMNKGKGVKVSISAVNQSVTKTDTVNFQSNYWGSSDSATIASYIKDYNDDINILGRVDFSSYKNSPIIGCSYNSGCSVAHFTYSQADSVITFTDNSYGSKPHRSRWNFGDGNQNDSDKKVIVHSYDKPGTYMACLYVSDTSGNLCDSMCVAIEIKNTGTCHASYYFAIDTSNFNNVFIVNTSKGINSQTKYYWTFGDGTGSSATNPNHTYSSIGHYQICLTIFDTAAGCYSTFCDSVEISINGMELFVLNEKDVLNIKNAVIVNSIELYPNPNTGQFKLSLNNYQTNRIKIDVMNSAGQIVKSDMVQPIIGTNEINMDMIGFENGIYCISIRSENFATTVKFILSK